MGGEGDLRSALASVPSIAIHGPWVRAIDARLLREAPPGEPRDSPPQPLWGGGARKHGGRFTPKESFDTLYLASALATLGMEIGAAFGPSQRVSETRDPFTVVHVTGRLTHVLDLRCEAVLAELGTTFEEITGAWRMERMPTTQRVGMAARESGRFCAIVAPSARTAGNGFVVAVFTDLMANFPPSFVQSVDATGRLAQRLPP
jgi:RES domain-containing protein